MAAFQHARQECAHGAEHRARVQLEREFPLVVGRFQDGALVHEAGAVEQDVDGTGVAGRLGDVGVVQHVQLRGADPVGGDLVHQRLVHVGGDHLRALGGEGERGGAADALRRRR